MKKLLRENMSSQLITIGWNERMDTAYKRMQEKSVRHLPVLNELGEVIGMLSDRDVQRAMVSTVKHEHMSQGACETIEFDPQTHVRDYMSWPIIAVDYHTELRIVTERMIQEKVSSFLVIQGDRTVGIVTAEDLLRVLLDLLADSKAVSNWTLSHVLRKS